MKAFRAANLAALVLALIAPLAPTLAQVQPERAPVSLKSISERIFPQAQPPNFSVNLVPPGAISSSTDSLDLTPLSITPLDPSDFSSQSFTIAEKTPLLILPEGSCTASDYGLLPTCLFPPPSHFNTWDSQPALYPAPSVQSPPRTSEKFHWKSAFWQSFGFLVVGHAFRLANDDGARYLLFHKPFWHDYWSSTAHFDMSQWGDGDSFIVNYIGHPMEGAVYGNIFINNDPKGRAARFGKSSNYWYSRLKAMAWSTAWEAYFEIGPVFSEAALGNEGGYTYVPGCGLYPCDKYPGKTFKPPTNNTGWVDFVVTPVVGMGWMVLEDAIEREFVDRLADGSTALKYKILRGSLTPTHTFANLFAGKVPWYRYPEEGSFQQSFGGPLHSVERPAWKDDPRFSLGVQYISMDLPLDSETCQNCRQFYSGYGFDFTYRLAKYAWFDSVANIVPGSGSYGEHGGVQEGLVGFKFGRSLGNWGIYSNLRNGFIHYDKTLLPGSTSAYESTWRYALDLGGTVEYSTSSHSTIRFNAGTTLIHYLQPSPDTSKYQPPVGVISTQYYSFQGSPYLTTGYVFRF